MLNPQMPVIHCYCRKLKSSDTPGTNFGDCCDHAELAAYDQTPPTKVFTRHPCSQRMERGKMDCLRDDRKLLVGLRSRNVTQSAESGRREPIDY